MVKKIKIEKVSFTKNRSKENIDGRNAEIVGFERECLLEDYNIDLQEVSIKKSERGERFIFLGYFLYSRNYEKYFYYGVENSDKIFCLTYAPNKVNRYLIDEVPDWNSTYQDILNIILYKKKDSDFKFDFNVIQGN